MLATENYFGGLLRGWDAQFYYAAAHSIVHDRDLDITNDIAQSPAQWVFVDQAGRNTLPLSIEGRVLNKYPIGLSLVETLPLAVERTGVLGSRRSGYDATAIRTSALWLAFLAAGAVSLTAVWLNGKGLSVVSAVALSGLVLFGTSQFYYSGIFPFMAHGVTALWVIALILCTERLASVLRPHLLGIWTVLAALLVLTRPQQATLVLLLGAALMWLHRRRHSQALSVAAALATAVGSALVLQSFANYFAFGAFRFNAYAAGGESFDFLHPSYYTVLASGGRGLFFLAPITLLAVPGTLLAVRYGAVAQAITANLLLQIALVAAWSSPAQGDAFGARMFVELSPAFALGLGTLLTRAPRWSRIIWLLSVLFASWTMLAMISYVFNGISPEASHSDVMRGVLDTIRRVTG